MFLKLFLYANKGYNSIINNMQGLWNKVVFKYEKNMNGQWDF